MGRGGEHWVSGLGGFPPATLREERRKMPPLEPGALGPSNPEGSALTGSYASLGFQEGFFPSSPPPPALPGEPLDYWGFSHPSANRGQPCSASKTRRDPSSRGGTEAPRNPRWLPLAVTMPTERLLCNGPRPFTVLSPHLHSGSHECGGTSERAETGAPGTPGSVFVAQGAFDAPHASLQRTLPAAKQHIPPPTCDKCQVSFRA